jgi:hypothetical protein
MAIFFGSAVAYRPVNVLAVQRYARQHPDDHRPD